MILVIEDNVDDSFLLTRELARSDMATEIRVIGDGRDALDFIFQTSPAPFVVFLDLKLPRLSGIEVLKEIRQEPRLHDLPVIVMTSSLNPKDADDCARLGVSAFLPKPVSLDLFKKIIGAEYSGHTLIRRPIDPHFIDVATTMVEA